MYLFETTNPLWTASAMAAMIRIATAMNNQFLESAADKDPERRDYILNLQASWASLPGQV